MSEEILSRLNQLFEDAKRNYRESRSDYDAGVVEGLKRALEVVENGNNVIQRK